MPSSYPPPSRPEHPSHTPSGSTRAPVTHSLSPAKHPSHTHCPHTLLSHTALIHPSHTPLSHTPLTHSSHTLLSHTSLSHSSHTPLSHTPFYLTLSLSLSL